MTVSDFTILRDTREQLPWEFEPFPVSVTDETLNTGDYTIAEFCDHDADLDTYHPEFAIERKSGSDFLDSIGSRRSRFKKEIKRASEWNRPLLVVIEESRSPSRYTPDFIEPSGLSRKQVFGTVNSWEKHYNVVFRFAGDRGRAQRITYEKLRSQLRNRLFSN